MFVKGNILYSDAYKYLKRKGLPIVTMVAPLTNTTKDDYEEVSFISPLDVVVEGKFVYWGNKLFCTKVKSLRYADIKTAIIKMRYSDDDQMALILNREKSEEGAKLYDKMQEWRDFATVIAKSVDSGSV